LPVNELKALYKDSTLFWHLCGLSHKDPSENEHFGMTIVEAMQNKLIPLVYDSGGPREIVDHGENGFRVQSTAELIDFTIKLIKNPVLIQKLSNNAYLKSREFSKQKFKKKIQSFFQNMMDEYSSIS
jgi:glycosyltransferase involved in cell wall biosynthesis